MNILQINSSARREGSQSTLLANSLVDRLRRAYPDASLTVRDLATNPHPHLDEAALQAYFTHPVHQKLVDWLMPLLAVAAELDYEA